MGRGVALAAGVAVWGLWTLGAGCESVPFGPAPGARAVRPGDPGGPFAPASIRVLPLTHVEAPEPGPATLVAHVEFRDRWGDATKGAGDLRLILAREVNGVDRQVMVWNPDLRDLELNAALFDPTTKTYRFALTGLAADDAAAAAGTLKAPGRVRLLAILAVEDAEGRVVTMRDVYALGRTR